MSGPIRALLVFAATLASTGCSETTGRAADGGSALGASSVQGVGQSGGRVELDDGASVEVPRLALPAEYVIGIAVVTASLPAPPADLELASQAYAFTPHSLPFAEPATISIPFTSSKLGKVVLRLDDERDPDWEVIEEASFRMNIATLMVDSFSVYAVAHPAEGLMITCEANRTLCDGRCVNTGSDNNNCGVCRVSCGRGQQCMGGVCIQVEEPPMDAGTQPPVDAGMPAACSADGDCDDGQYCNGAESCPAGACVPGTAVSCDDADPTTSDSCNEGTDMCVHAPMDDAGAAVAI